MHLFLKTAKPVTRNRTGRGGILVGGTLVIVIAAGIGMQVWRARSSRAAEQKAAAAVVPADSETGRRRLFASTAKRSLTKLWPKNASPSMAKKFWRI